MIIFLESDLNSIEIQYLNQTLRGGNLKESEKDEKTRRQLIPLLVKSRHIGDPPDRY
jgi:hypothetical protein